MPAAGGRPWHSIFEARPLVVLGHYSYAIYLLHDPAIALTTGWLYHPRDTAWPYPVEQSLVELVLAISLAAARISWLALEGPALPLWASVPPRLTALGRPQGWRARPPR
jgi:peptidoglycan/LPS O-acetylase OafA/YrhL